MRKPGPKEITKEMSSEEFYHLFSEMESTEENDEYLSKILRSNPDLSRDICNRIAEPELENAVTFTSEDGKVKVTICMVDSPQEEFIKGES